jgi:hypothetical protein
VFGYLVMVRPDAMAELLGLAGFLLTGAGSRGGRLAGAALLALAALTKQTAVLFLLAGALALAAEGRWRLGLGLLGGVLAALGIVVLAVDLLIGPRFLPSLLGERMLPWSGRLGLGNLLGLCERSPDLLLLPAIGLVLCLVHRDRPGYPRAAALMATILAGSFVLSMKVGADFNYYFSQRISEAVAFGLLCREAVGPSGRLRSATLVAAAALVLGTMPLGIRFASRQWGFAREKAAPFAGPEGRSILDLYRRVFAMARDPRVHLLTDSGLIDLYQGPRAAFGDPWLFKTLVELGRIRPGRIAQQIDSQYYDYIITTSDLNAPGYADGLFALPAALVGRARRRYGPIGAAGTFLFYGRSGGVRDATPPSPGRGRAAGGPADPPRS